MGVLIYSGKQLLSPYEIS